MQNIKLKGYTVTEMNVIIKEIPVNHEVESNFEYSIKQDNNNYFGRAILTCIDKNNKDAFSLKIEMIGEFECTEIEEKNIIHVRTFELLYPYVRNAVANLTAAASLPALFLPVTLSEDIFQDVIKEK